MMWHVMLLLHIALGDCLERRADPEGKERYKKEARKLLYVKDGREREDVNLAIALWCVYVAV